MRMNRLTKTLLGGSLSLALLTTGNLVIGAPQAHAATVSASSQANNVVATGQRFLGVRYQFGAPSGNPNSFDCSSFTQYVFQQNGIKIPRNSRQQSQVGTYVPRSKLKPGDLVFFYSPIHHVGIYIGNGKMINTYGKGGVTITDINSGWWNEHYTTARRVIQ
ncbi:NlpC/P60 family protein [Paenibacillus sp. yr247]|nr:NlpC/P60 family protein [Paenibacillus sp. yr247]